MTLTTDPKRLVPRHSAHARKAACGEMEGLHSARHVTVELRRRYNMSHRRLQCGSWHARCLSSQQKGATHTPGRKQASGFTKKIAEPRTGLTPPTRSSRDSITTTNDDTPPQIKQATKPPSHNGGFFSPVRAARLEMTSAGAVKRMARRRRGSRLLPDQAAPLITRTSNHHSSGTSCSRPS